MRKKIFGFVLVVAMVVILFAGMTVTVSAADDIELPEDSETTATWFTGAPGLSDGDIATGYNTGATTTLEDAFAGATDDPEQVTYVRLNESIGGWGDLELAEGTTVVFDMDGHTISASYNTYVTAIFSYGDLTVKNGTIKAVSGNNYAIAFDVFGNLTVENTTISVTSSDNNAIGVQLNSGAALNVVDSKISATAENGYAYGIYDESTEEVEITVTGADTENCSISANSKNDAFGVFSRYTESIVSLTNVAIDAVSSNGSAYGVEADGASIAVSNCNIYADSDAKAARMFFPGAYGISATSGYSVSGGSITARGCNTANGIFVAWSAEGTIENCNISAEKYSDSDDSVYGIYTENSLTVSGGSITAANSYAEDAMDAYGIGTADGEIIVALADAPVISGESADIWLGSDVTISAADYTGDKIEIDWICSHWDGDVIVSSVAADYVNMFKLCGYAAEAKHLDVEKDEDGNPVIDGDGNFNLVVTDGAEEHEPDATDPELESLDITLIQSATFDAIVNGETLPDLDDLIGMGGMFAEATLVGGITNSARYMSAQWMYAPIDGGNIQEAEYDHVADTDANNYYIEITVANFSANFQVGEDLVPGDGIYIHNEDDVAYTVDSYNFVKFEAQESRNGFIAVIEPANLTTGTIWNWSELKNGDILKPGDIVNNDIGNDVEEATINVRDRHYDRNVYISVNGSVTLEGSYTAEDGAAPNYKIESEEWVVMIDYLYPDPETRDYGERRVNLVKKADANWVEAIEVDVEQTEGEDSYTITLVDKEPGYLYVVMGVQDLFDEGLIGYNEIRGQAEFMCEMIAMTIQETEKAAEDELDMINQMALTTDSFEAPSCSLVFITKLKQADGVEGKEYNYLIVGATYLVTDRLTHDVTVADTENGTVAASVSAAKELDTVTLTVTPAEGYELESLTVKDAEGNTVPVEDNTFIMPRSAVTVTAVFAESEIDEPETPPADGDSVIGNNGYPYGKDMNYSSVTLVVDTKVSGATYQWQSSTEKNGTYTNIEDAEDAAYIAYYPTSGTWYRCVVNGEASKAVQIVSPGYDDRNWTASSGSYYVSNGTMAYRVNGYMFDVTGLYYKNGTAYMLQTSYSYAWTMYSSESAEPEGSSYSYASYANLDALKVSFDESNAYRVIFEADLAEGQQAFSFGCDTQLGNSSTSGSYADSAALIGTVKNDSLLQVAMIGAASQEAALGTDPAFVIAPDSSTPASRFWIGHYSSRQTYAYNTYKSYGCSVEKINGEDVVTRVEGDDSGMTVSWMNIPSGGSVKFEFKVGSVADTGAVPGASVELTSKTVTIKDTENTFFYQILDENGMPLEGITYMDANGNELTPDEDGWVRGIGGDIIISGLQQSTSYQIVTAAKNEDGVIDEENAAVEDVITPINPGVTVDPETGEETEIVCVATGNSLTFTGLNENHYYFLQTEDGYEITGEYIDGELVFSELPAGYDFYLAAVSEDNQTYEPVLYSTNSVTVTFDANGGVDAPEAQTLAGENQYLTWEIPYREGYVFQGWAGSTDAERVEYWPDDWPNLSEDTTLYAVWEEIEKVDLEGEAVFNYSYSYTLPNGSVQRGTQNEGERATKVRITLLKNGTPVGEPVVVDVEMFDDYAVGTYCFEDMPLTNEYGSYINYTVQAVALRDDESENRDYGVYCSGYSYVSLSYSPECFDAQWKITINNLDDSYPVPDSVFVKVLYATEQGAELKDYQVITQQVSGYGTECIKVAAGDVITYSGSYPVWKYQADVGGSYYHKVQILGYMLDGVYIDLTDEGYIFDGEMFYDTETDSASEVMELSYNKTLIPTVGVEGDILVNYSYSYTLPGGAVQEGTQNMTERVRTVRVELLCNGIVVDSVDVDLSVVGDIATGSYSFGRWQKYGEYGVNSYSVHAYALDESSETVHDYSVDITRFDAVLTYSPECFDAAWMVVLGGEIPEDLIPSSINVKILYATESGAALEDYEMISQQANNLGVECVLVEDGNGGMTYSGSYPVWKYQADVGGTYYHKIQIVGYTIDGVYYDVSYKALISEGEMYFDGKNPSCVMEMTLIPEIPAEEITVSGKVLDSNNVGVHGATVELRKGNEVIATTTTDIYGHYSFVDVPDGDYNIVVTYKEGMSDEATEKVLTELVAVDRESGESPNITMEMPDGNVSSVVEIKEEGVEYQKLNPAGALVAGVGEVAKNETPADGQHITIKLEVTPAADLTDSDDEAVAEIKAEQAEIKAQAGDKILEFLDLTLTKTVSENGSDVSSNIEEASALLTIILPFDAERAEAVVVYRYHDGVAAAMTEKPAAGEEGYVVGDGVVIIYAQKFSTYAIGYREADPDSRVYSVVASESENGTVTLGRDYAYVNTLVSFTVTPDDGYELEKLTVIDENGRGVALTDLGNGTYSFRMPNGNVTVSAAFAAVNDACAKDSTCPAGSFTDTDADEWYHDGVHYCVEEGLMVGMPGDLFDPNGSTTRAQIVTVLWRLEGSPVVDADMTFADVAADEWYTEAIRWAQSVGVVEGYSETAFGPNDTVTREQLAVILYRYEQYKGGGFKGMWMFLLNYPDRADVSDWAYEAMCWMTMHKVIDGVPNGDGVKLDPAGSATRAQVATMLWRFCQETGN